MSTLIDLGERQILQKIIPRFTTGAGDDCACLEIPSGQLVATTDPVPPPAAASIGGDDDPFWMGWLLVTINVSDLAAAGATPLAFLAAIECESTRPTTAFERLLEGIKASCEGAGIAYVGGNLREAPRLSAVGTALGFCESYKALTRKGVRDGDLIISVGQGGVFWRDALRLLDGDKINSKEHSPVFKPRSQIHVMHRLAEKGLIAAAMDNSDGLLPTLNELANKNSLGAVLDLDSLVIPDLTNEEQKDAARFWLGWGDWNVIGCISPSQEKQITDIAKGLGTPIHRIGKFTADHSGVVVRRGDRLAPAPRLESERFAKDSWMLKGINEYIRMLRTVPLP